MKKNNDKLQLLADEPFDPSKTPASRNRYSVNIILFSISVLSIFLFFLVPIHRQWGQQRLIPYWKDFLQQTNQQDPELRKTRRFGKEYLVSKQIAERLAQKGNRKTALLLLPPTTYFKKHNIQYEVPDPGIFYYFTDLKTILADNTDATTANWYVRIQNQEIIVDSVTDPTRLKDIISSYYSSNSK